MKEVKRTVRKYTEDFKRQALALAEQLGSVRKAASQLGMPADTLHGWSYRRRERTDFGADRPGSASTPAITVQQLEEENRRLRRELEQTKKANYILKQAAAFFSQDHLK